MNNRSYGRPRGRIAGELSLADGSTSPQNHATPWRLFPAHREQSLCSLCAGKNLGMILRPRRYDQIREQCVKTSCSMRGREGTEH